MQVAVERRPGSIVALTITVEPAVLQQHMEQLFEKHARRVSVPGFRPGKAPRRLLEERINQQLLQQEAVEATIDTTYKAALHEQNLEPLERGEIEDLDTADDLTLTYTVLVSVRPEVTLQPYEGLKVKTQATKVTDEQATAEIERLRERTADFSEVMDDGIVNGDYVTIDYTMTLDDEPYPDGDTSGYPLEVGTDTFFPELNKGLLGVKQGETTTITTTYSADYSNKEWAAKTASFAVTIQQVRRLIKPDADDAWAQIISQGALPTIEELRTRLKANLQAMAAQADHEHVRNELVRQVVEGASLDIPDTLVEEEYEHLLHELEHQLSHERMSLEDYAESTNRGIEDIKNEQHLLARDMVRRSLALQEVARREDLFVTAEDLDDTLEALAAGGGRTARAVRAELEKEGRLETLTSRIFHEKVLGFLESHAQIEIEGKEEPVELTAPEAPPAEVEADATPTETPESAE
jgi:trigger factor